MLTLILILIIASLMLHQEHFLFNVEHVHRGYPQPIQHDYGTGSGYYKTLVTEYGTN